MGPVGDIGLKDARGEIKWYVNQKFFEASFEGSPTGLDGACDKRKPFASVIGCLFKMTKKDRPKPFRITYSSRTGALGVEQLTARLGYYPRSAAAKPDAIVRRPRSIRLQCYFFSFPIVIYTCLLNTWFGYR